MGHVYMKFLDMCHCHISADSVVQVGVYSWEIQQKIKGSRFCSEVQTQSKHFEQIKMS